MNREIETLEFLHKNRKMIEERENKKIEQQRKILKKEIAFLEKQIADDEKLANKWR